MRHLIACIALLALGTLTPHASAQRSFDWSTFTPGGTSAGGSWSMTGSIGQPCVGAPEGGTFSFQAGFWPGATGGGPPPCVADFNGDGNVNTQDVLSFLNAWVARDPRADVNGDGTVNTLDFLFYLNLWTAGC